MIAPELSCSNEYYSLGILAPNKYISVLQLFQEFTDVPVTYYTNENTTKPLVNILVNFVSKHFHAIDLLLTDSKVTLDLLINETNRAGICVKSLDNFEIIQNDNKALIVIAAHEEYIKSLIEPRIHGGESRKTWIILPLDDSDVKDVIPLGSYLITAEDFLIVDLDADGLTAHWPHLLSIGKSIIAIAELLSDLRRQSCRGTDECSLPKFDSKLLGEISNSKVFQVLRIPKQMHTIKYSIFKRLNDEQQDLHEINFYQVDVATYQMTTNLNKTILPNCYNSNISCVNCVNLWKNIEDTSLNNSNANSEVRTSEKSYLKTDLGVLVFLILIVCGTITSLVVGGFVLFRFFVDEVLDGNPMLTLLLIIANIFVLHSVIPFCFDDDILGHEYLNSRKIFVTSLSMGFVFSIMLTRSFFLAFSTGGVFTNHINGYLQGLMVFFTFGIQLAMSTMYFIIAPSTASDVLHSPIFIALLSYNIFLLITLFGVGIVIGNIPRNYYEGKCICFTVISLMIVWLAWIIAFPLVAKDWGDIMIAGLLITTAYVVLGGIFLPRVYYMVTHLDNGKKSTANQLKRKTSIRTKSRRPFYDYVLPMEGVTNSSGLHQASNPNFYGTASPSHRRQQSGGSISSRVDNKDIGFNNFGYHPDMQETENHYVVPRVCIENSDVRRKSSEKNNSSHYAQPTYHTRVHESESDDDDCIETDIYLEGKRLSPSRIGPNESYPSRCSSPRLCRTEATIDEEDEEIHDQESTKITRF
ncbi:hypothetical protein PV327_006410 [Microctonus hyperodae]|nr:hypothetical protein PV327_006410 [Microctonus hyperodae]